MSHSPPVFVPRQGRLINHPLQGTLSPKIMLILSTGDINWWQRKTYKRIQKLYAVSTSMWSLLWVNSRVASKREDLVARCFAAEMGETESCCRFSSVRYIPNLMQVKYRFWLLWVSEMELVQGAVYCFFVRKFHSTKKLREYYRGAARDVAGFQGRDSFQAGNAAMGGVWQLQHLGACICVFEVCQLHSVTKQNHTI